jgi:signal transduction histidine kinase
MHLTARVPAPHEDDEISALSQTFNKMLDRLQEAFDLQQGFVSNASHGIRTPLTAVHGQIETALLKTRTLDEYQAILKSIHGDIRRLTNLSNSLLYLAQSNTDLQKLLVHNVRIDEVLLQTQTEIEQVNKNYVIITDFDQLPEDESRLAIHSNENLLKMIFFNLMDNACKYSDDHKVYITISFSDTETIMQFSDHGRGISKFDQRNIFEPFYRGANTSDTKGHGMGLSLVKKILDLHRVRIMIQSQLGSGTTISLFFPQA